MEGYKEFIMAIGALEQLRLFCEDKKRTGCETCCLFDMCKNIGQYSDIESLAELAQVGLNGFTGEFDE